MTYKPTAEQVNAFKAAWHDADDNGQAGKRVEIALAAVLGPAIADSWDEGRTEGIVNTMNAVNGNGGETRTPNPYR